MTTTEGTAAPVPGWPPAVDVSSDSAAGEWTAGPWRLVDDLATPRHAEGQMAADVALLEALSGGGPPVLRLYRWDPPALSLGRFQPDGDADVGACARFGVEVVRRPTGGRALLHGADLTYAVALRRPRGAAGGVEAIYCRLAQGLVAGLAALGIGAAVASGDGEAGAACLFSSLGSDLRVGTRKVCGSAQVHRSAASPDGTVSVLQHGSILVDRLPFDETDLLAYDDAGRRDADRARLRERTVTLRELGVAATVEELAGAIAVGFAAALGAEFTRRPTSASS